MAAKLTTTIVPRVVYNTFEEFKTNPQRMWDWIYKVSEEIQKNSANSTTTAGDMKIIGGSTVPSDWLVTDGSTVSSSAYPALHSALYPDDASLTFKLPDLRALIVDNTTGDVFTLDTAIKSPFTVIIKT